MASGTTFDAGQISNTGDAHAWVIEVTSAGDNSGGTWEPLPIVETSTFSDSTEIIEREDEGRNTYSSLGKRTVSMQLTFMQMDIATKNLGAVTQRDTTISIAKIQQSIGTDYEFIWLPLGKWDPTSEETPLDGNRQITFNAQALPEQQVVNFTDTDLSGAGFSFDFTLTGAVGDYYQRHLITFS